MQGDPQILLTMGTRQDKYSALICTKSLNGMRRWIIGMKEQEMAQQLQRDTLQTGRKCDFNVMFALPRSDKCD